MQNICPKCHYARKVSDTAPAWRCPSCEVAYVKASDAAYAARSISSPSAATFRPSMQRSSIPWGWVLLIAVVAVGGWQGKAFSNRTVPGAGIERPANANGQPSVVFFSATWCGYCTATRNFFNQNGIAYTELDIESSAAGAEGYEKLGGGGIPLILIGNEKLRGFNGSLLQQRLEPWMKRS